MSKSFGNIIPLQDALKTYGADPFRIAVLATAELLQDADFSRVLAKSIKDRLERFYSYALKVIKAKKDEGETPLKPIDNWMLSRLQHHIKTVTLAMENLRFRQAIQTTLYLLDQDIQWYLKRVDQKSHSRAVINRVLQEVLHVKVLLLTPFAPHLCEEIWQQMGQPRFVSIERWPQYEEAKIDNKILLSEDLVKSWEEDIQNIIQATKITPTRICLYAASKWKWTIYLQAIALVETKALTVKNLLKPLMKDPALKKNARQVSTFVQKMVSDLQRSPPEILEKRLRIGFFDDFKLMNEVKDYYATELTAHIEVYREDGENIYDPNNRSGLAEPYRPAIFIE